MSVQQCACCLELAEKHKKEMHDLASVAHQAQGSMRIAREELHQIFKLQQQLLEAHTLAVQGQQSTHSEVSMGFQQLLCDSLRVVLWPYLHNIERAAQQQDAGAEKDRAHAAEVAALTRKLAEVETALEWSTNYRGSLANNKRRKKGIINYTRLTKIVKWAILTLNDNQSQHSFR